LPLASFLSGVTVLIEQMRVEPERVAYHIGISPQGRGAAASIQQREQPFHTLAQGITDGAKGLDVFLTRRDRYWVGNTPMATERCLLPDSTFFTGNIAYRNHYIGSEPGQRINMLSLMMPNIQAKLCHNLFSKRVEAGELCACTSYCEPPATQATQPTLGNL
jgi:hypothetical protein